MHYIFDSFEGLSCPAKCDKDYWKKGDLKTSINVLVYNLKPFESSIDYTIYPGWIPDQFANLESSRISFLHIDVDIYQPTRDSVDFFYSRMAKGGVMLFDDYGFLTCPGASAAVDEFFSDKIEKIFEIPCGGGFVIKA